MFFIGGLDEAGLGPVLGPYTAFMTYCFFDQNPERSLDQLNIPSISDQASSLDSIIVSDSKKLYSRSRDLTILEESVLSLLTAATGSCPTNFNEFLQQSGCLSADIQSMKQKSWYNYIEQIELPISASMNKIKHKAEKLRSDFISSGIQSLSFKGRVITEEEFNNLLKTHQNKAVACQEILTPLLRSLIGTAGKLTVDRQGGRKFYGEWIVELFPGHKIQIRAETAGISLYRIDDLEIGFMVRADASVMETAMASMFSKYTREIAMLCFNQYWFNKSGGRIRSTAGYPQDGKRFIRELEQFGLLPQNRDSLIRLK